MTTPDSEYEFAQMIVRQTGYSLEVAQEKLKEHNNDPMAVVQSFLKVKKQQQTASSNSSSIQMSTNQEIYKQLRHKLDDISRDYRERANKGETRV